MRPWALSRLSGLTSFSVREQGQLPEDEQVVGLQLLQGKMCLRLTKNPGLYPGEIMQES